MLVDRYRQKRRFDRTTEPEGGSPDPAQPLRFAVQKHDASRLHFDLRLEVDGVLKSWAVPKGPSFEPGDRRLAMMVEDHPFDYRTFEGVIPAGEYGGGTVMLWDEGVYSAPDARSREEAEEKVRAGLAKGHVAVVLAGSKLEGLWDLVHIRGRGGEENAWLLTRRGDDAGTPADDDAIDRSVASGRTMAEIAEQADRTWRRVDPPDDAPEAPFPDDLKPMLAHSADEAFDDPRWLFEIKWDGYRILAFVHDGRVELRSRGAKDYTSAYAAIADDLGRLGVDAVLDGEVVAFDEDGRSDFQLLQQHGSSPAERLAYVAFDLLHLRGRSLLRLPLARRKELLRELVTEDLPRVRYADHVEGDGVAFAAAATGLGLEGVMAKKLDSTYLPGKRTRTWLKIKTTQRREALIGGFTEPRGGRKHVGAVLLGVRDDGDELRYIGHTGAGGGEAEHRALRTALDALERPSSPFTSRPRPNAPVHWVEPSLSCEVAYTEETADGKLRHPIFLRLLSSPEPEPEAEPEPQPDAAGAPGASSGRSGRRPAGSRKSRRDRTLEIGGEELTITNWDKPYWPDDGITKGDLVEYYLDVAEVMVPYLRDRPESLHRFPDGIGGKHFFHKDMRGTAPSFARTTRVTSEADGSTIEYLVCDDAVTLAYMAGLGCIEIHPWNSRVAEEGRPDWCVLDFDPFDSNPYTEVVEAARSLHRICERAGIPSYPKTSGATGLHVYIPLGALYPYEQARQFGEALAHLVNDELPATTTLERSPSKRGGRIYLDYLQNRRGQTLAAPYSVRPRRGATVSTPLTWGEVTKRLDPARYTLRNLRRRLDRKGDLFAGVLGDGIDLAAVLEALSG